MRDHAFNAVVAFLFSVLIWSAVGAQLREEKTVGIDFVVRVPETVTLSYEDEPAAGALEVPLAVTVRGPRELIARLTEREIVGQRDLSQEPERLQELLEEGQDTITVRAEDISVPPQLEVVGTRPEDLTVGFSRVRGKDVEVTHRVEGSPAPGFEVQDVSIRPSLVRVRGPEAILEERGGPYPTEPIDLAERTERFIVEKGVDCPAGVTTDARVEVVVEIAPVPVREAVRFPIHILRSTAQDGARLERRVEDGDYVVEPRDQDAWIGELTLEGPRDGLQELQARLDQEIAKPGSEQGLPVAYIRASEFPREDGAEEPLDVEVIGLPEGVRYPAVEKFPIRVRRRD